MSSQAVFFDTWGWIALGHPRDAGHPGIVSLYGDLKRNGTPIFTSDYVLAEVATFLFRRERFEEAERFMSGLFDAVGQGKLTLGQISPERFSRAWELRRKYRDKPTISFTDLSSMALMAELGLTRIVTEGSALSPGGARIHLAITTARHATCCRIVDDGAATKEPMT